MEPVTLTLSLGLAIFNWIAVSDKQDAEAAFWRAVRQENEAYKDFVSQHRATVVAREHLDSYRIASIRWMLPTLEEAFARGNASTAGLYDGLDGLLTARSCDEIERMVDKVIACFPHINRVDQGGALPVSMAALMVKAMQAADASGRASFPILHGTVGDALSRLPIDGSDTWVRSLGSAGHIPMADAIAAPLLVFSVFQLASNLSTTSTLSADAGKLVQAAAVMRSREQEARQIELSIRRVSEAHHESSYQAFRAAMVAEAILRRRADLPANIVESALIHLRGTTEIYIRTIKQDWQSA